MILNAALCPHVVFLKASKHASELLDPSHVGTDFVIFELLDGKVIKAHRSDAKPDYGNSSICLVGVGIMEG
jgi:hypothetical protein